jgi:Fic family protein
MRKIAHNQQAVLNILLRKESLSSSEVHAELLEMGSEISLITVKRELSELKMLDLIRVSGAGRSVRYLISSLGRLLADVNAKEYMAIEPDKRFGLKNFNFELFEAMPNELFSDTEIQVLEEATAIYAQRVQSISDILEEKELERFIIELSWKSSKIEGNTYTLLDTEKLISRGIEAAGHDRREAEMIVNHKEAFRFIRENSDSFKELNLSKLEEVHKHLVKDLNVNFGIRSKAVGVTGSVYRPLDTSYQIKEAVIALCTVVNRATSPYSKAMIALLGISYIQPFEDGNKRTSRLIANSILLAQTHAPLSYRSVDENEYREAVLTFYELNSLVPFKKIFMEQYVFAAKNYAVTGER